jgi:transposase-like protein
VNAAAAAMTTTRKQCSPKFKAKVVVEAIRGERTLTQLASQFHVHPMQVGHRRVRERIRSNLTISPILLLIHINIDKNGTASATRH